MFGKITGFFNEDEKYFVSCKENIATKNFGMLIKSCILYSFVLGFYTILTVATNQPQISRIMYYTFDIIHICLCTVVFVGNRMKIKNLSLIQLLCIFLEISILSFFVLEGVFVNKAQHSLYIPIAILLVLLIFTHRAIYAYIITGIYPLSFAILSVLYKTPEAYTNDLYISIATFIAASIGYYLIAQIRHSEGAALIKYEKLSRTDQLTEILNKSAILKICEQILCDAERTCAFIIIDLDNFKEINDRYGHNVGDEVLKMIGQKFQSSFRKTDFVGRFGGDEFIAIMENCRDIKIIEGCMEVLFSNINKLTFSEEGLDIKYSAGITLKHEGDTINTILNRADNALYQSKKSKKGSYMIVE